MKAVILSAGQGRRLLPLTRQTPKCALPVGGQPLVAWQVEQLLNHGVDSVTVVVGFEAGQVERILADRFPADAVRTVFNPHHDEADNLVSCWSVRQEMTEDFLLLNGDTLFEGEVLDRLLETSPRPLTLVTDRKPAYDEDDMKVRTDGEALVSVGKGIPAEEADGESIGLMAFREKAPAAFREVVEAAVRGDDAPRQWYLTAVDELARRGLVGVCPIEGCRWTEVDTRTDLEEAERLVGEEGLIPRPVAALGSP